jgi:serine/threonine protein kinase
MAALTDVPRSSEEWRAFLPSRVKGSTASTRSAKIGEGGMGAVYRASQAMMKREVAVKLLPVDRAGKDGLVRFDREVQLTSRLESPKTIASHDDGRTTTASLTGPPLYLSPESITAPDEVDGGSDLYAAGGVAYWLLTGTHVFGASTVVEVCSHDLHASPESPSARLGQPVPRDDREAVVLKCLEKDPAKRYPNADALAHALEACERSDDWSDDLSAPSWRAHETEADEAKPKIAPTSRIPEPIDVDLESRRQQQEQA